MEEFATSSVATTTCSYFYEGELMASSSCASLTMSPNGVETVISTDPMLTVIAAAALMLYAATYVRRVFFS